MPVADADGDFPIGLDGAHAGAEAARAVAKGRARPEAVEEFEMVAAGIAERDGCPKHVALERARRERPDLYRAMQSA